MNILLIENNHDDAQRMQAMLSEEAYPLPHVERVDCLAAGLDRLAQGGIEVVLVDLSQPDSQGLETFCRVYAKAPLTPIIVLSQIDDEALAIRALQEGAQDYLVKGQLDGALLVRALRYAVERHRMQMTIQKLTYDDLTGLYNRRGFMTHAEQHLKLAHRAKRGLLLFLIDVDHLKQINDTFGHLEGDQALQWTAEILRKTFRSSDVIARLGGDEFAILAIDASESNADLIIARLKDNQRDSNVRNSPRYTLSLSIGVAPFDPKTTFSVERLIGKADELLYEQKRYHHRNEALRILVG